MNTPPIPPGRPRETLSPTQAPNENPAPTTGTSGIRSVYGTDSPNRLHYGQLLAVEEQQPTGINTRTTAEAAPKPSFFSRWLPWRWGKKNPNAEQPKAAPQSATPESLSLSRMQRLINGGAAAWNYVAGGAAQTGSDLIDAAVAKAADLEVMESEKKQWGTLLSGVIWNYMNRLGDQAEQQYRFAKILKKRPDEEPIKITNLEFDIKQVPDGPNSVLFQDQPLKNHFKIRHLHCTVEIPVPGNDDPISCNVDIHDADITMATRLALANLPRIVLGNAETHIQDDTVLQLDAENVDITFNDAATYIPLDDQPESLQSDHCAIGFNSGRIGVNKLRLAAPINLFKQNSEQTTVISCQSISLESECDKDSLIDLTKAEIIHGDDRHNGLLNASVNINTRALSNISFLGKCMAWLFPKPMNITICTPLHEGELRLKDLKQSIQLSGGSPLIRWLFKKVLQAKNTKFVTTEQGTGLQIGWPVIIVVTDLEIDGLVPASPVDVNATPGRPLDNNFLTARSRADGYLVLPDTISASLSLGMNEEGMDKSRPVRLIASHLENICAEAAKKNDDACLILMNFARNADASHHDHEQVMALQAIPLSFYQRYIQHMSDSEWPSIEQQARKLLIVDTQKASQIYKVLLQRKDVRYVGDTRNPAWLIDVAKNLPTWTQQECDLVISMLEFAYKTDPKQAAKALPMLTAMLAQKQYSKDRAVQLLQELTSGVPYFQKAEPRINLLKTFHPIAPEFVKTELLRFPQRDMISGALNRTNRPGYIQALKDLHSLKNLMIDYGLITEAADLLIKARLREEAALVLDRAVAAGNPDALSCRVKYTLAGYIRGHSPESECRLLKHYMSQPDYPVIMKNRAQELLSHIIQTGDHPELAQVFLEDANSAGDVMPAEKSAVLNHAAQQLFNLKEDVFITPTTLINTLDEIKQQLNASLIDTEALNTSHPSHQTVLKINQQVILLLDVLDHLRSQCQPLLLAITQFQQPEAQNEVADETLVTAYEGDQPANTLTPEISSIDDDIFEDALEYQEGQEPSAAPEPAPLIAEETSIESPLQASSTSSIPQSIFGERSLYQGPARRFLGKELQSEYLRFLSMRAV